MNAGTVVFFSNPKGYGFIKPSSGGEDVFVHYSNIDMEGYRKLDGGDQVEYEIGVHPDNGKPQAINVRVIQKAVA